MLVGIQYILYALFAIHLAVSTFSEGEYSEGHRLRGGFDISERERGSETGLKQHISQLYNSAYRHIVCRQVGNDHKPLQKTCMCDTWL